MNTLHQAKDIILYCMKEQSFLYAICRLKHAFVYVSNTIIPVELKQTLREDLLQREWRWKSNNSTAFTGRNKTPVTFAVSEFPGKLETHNISFGTSQAWTNKRTTRSMRNMGEGGIALRKSADVRSELQQVEMQNSVWSDW